jgi:hypothetical protein
MVTKIHIKIDSREWDVELRGNATNGEVQAAIADITKAYPLFTLKLITVTHSGWLYDHLAPVADGWLAVNPWVRWGLVVFAAALVGTSLVV